MEMDMYEEKLRSSKYFHSPLLTRKNFFKHIKNFLIFI